MGNVFVHDTDDDRVVYHQNDPCLVHVRKHPPWHLSLIGSNALPPLKLAYPPNPTPRNLKSAGAHPTTGAGSVHHRGIHERSCCNPSLCWMSSTTEFTHQIMDSILDQILRPTMEFAHLMLDFILEKTLLPTMQFTLPMLDFILGKTPLPTIEPTHQIIDSVLEEILLATVAQ